MNLNDAILKYIEAHKDEAFELLVELAQIPALSNHEEQWAGFCKNFPEQLGCAGVYMDEMPMMCEGIVRNG